MKYIICFSGGHSSALAAIETVRRFGARNVVLLNHDISSRVEDMDVKRFKEEVADYLNLTVTYANKEGFEEQTPLAICREKGMFRFGAGSAICTYYLKTEPFYRWLGEFLPVRKGRLLTNATIVYGFDKNETQRIERRSKHLLRMGYLSDYPLARWERTIHNVEEVGIPLPRTYSTTRHANCIGCLKAGKQHWYMVYCLHPDVFYEASKAEEEIGYRILNGAALTDLEPLFKRMRQSGIPPGEILSPQRFWSQAKRILGRDGSIMGAVPF